jgi:hypothetical protein
MKSTFPFRILLLAALAAPIVLCAQNQKPLKPDVPGVQINHRLILKDGSYQIVRKYEIVGDRVRYVSVERGGEWEELPTDLVDWEATRKWERDHANQPVEAPSPAMKEAAGLDKEAAAEREELHNSRPEVAGAWSFPTKTASSFSTPSRGHRSLWSLFATRLWPTPSPSTDWRH